MATYHLNWRLDPSRVPADPKERSAAWGLLMGMIKNDREKGVLKDWGAYTSEGRGFCIVNGTQLEMMQMTEQYTPYVQFETHPVSSIDEINELLKLMAG